MEMCRDPDTVNPIAIIHHRLFESVWVKGAPQSVFKLLGHVVWGTVHALLPQEACIEPKELHALSTAMSNEAIACHGRWRMLKQTFQGST